MPCMFEPMSEAPSTSAAKAQRSRISQSDIPAYSLEKARRVPQAIADNYASHATRPIDIASAMSMQPSSGGFRGFLGAAIGYGLTEGGPNALEVSLTPLGARIVTPTEVDDDLLALREAALKPTVANQFYTRYDGSPLPPKNIAQNVLATLAVPQDRTGDVYDLLIENADYVGFLKTIKDKHYIDIGGSPIAPRPTVAEPGTPEDDGDLDETSAQTGVVNPAVLAAAAAATTAPSTPSAQPASEPGSAKNAIFVGHGGNKVPSQQLGKILNEYGIPHKEAVDEANLARPIPQKVAETMRDCGAAILVFTADKEYFDADGNSIWKASENVSHELGAASILYGERIIIFKEKGIDLPSNFSSVGYIEFEKDKLGDKGIELLRELIRMKILNFSIG